MGQEDIVSGCMSLSQSARARLYFHYTRLSYICYMFVQAEGIDLVVELPVEGQADGLKQQACVSVVGRVGVNSDVHTRNHLGRIAVAG